MSRYTDDWHGAEAREENEPVGDAAALTDDEFQSVMNGIAHLPCAEAGICQEPDPRAVIDRIIAERVTTARAQDADLLNRINMLTGRPVFGKETEPDVLYVRNADIVNLFDLPYRSTENTER